MGKILKKMADFKTKILKNIANNKAEIVFLMGVICVLCATFIINKILFLYVLGGFLIIFSLFIAKFYGK